MSAFKIVWWGHYGICVNVKLNWECFAKIRDANMSFCVV